MPCQRIASRRSVWHGSQKNDVIDDVVRAVSVAIRESHGARLFAESGLQIQEHAELLEQNRNRDIAVE
jgi:hypothetical protein